MKKIEMYTEVHLRMAYGDIEVILKNFEALIQLAEISPKFKGTGLVSVLCQIKDEAACVKDDMKLNRATKRFIQAWRLAENDRYEASERWRRIQKLLEVSP